MSGGSRPILILIILTVINACPYSNSIDNLFFTSITLVNNMSKTQINNYTIALPKYQKSRIIISIRQLQIVFSSNFLKLTVVKTKQSNVNILFDAGMNKWAKMGAIIGICGRQELIFNFVQIKNIQLNKQTSIAVDLNQTISDQNKTKIVLFLNGFNSTLKQSYFFFGINNYTLNNSKLTMNMSSDRPNLCTIYLSYIIYNSSILVYKQNKISISKLTGWAYPILSDSTFQTDWSIFGFNGISYTKQNSINITANLNKSQFSLFSQFPQPILIQYLIISNNYSLICGDCTNKYLFNDSCISSCPSGNQAIKLDSSLYLCRNCSKYGNYQFNNITLSCNCRQGYIIVEGICIFNKSKQQKLNVTIIPQVSVSSDLNLPNGTNQSKNCLQNSYLYINRCVCKVGYLNITGLCQSVQSIFKMSFPSSSTKILNSSVCNENQYYSLSSSACRCNEGYTISNKTDILQCISICPLSQLFDSNLRNCICKPNSIMINGLCYKCQTLISQQVNSTCYYLNNSLIPCRQNYTAIKDFCVLCPFLNISSVSNGSCSTCKQSFEYNGTICVCPSDSFISNGTCIRSTCRNAIIDNGQTCDDGNVLNGDGCSSRCMIETGYYCIYQNNKSKCQKSICGNGNVTGSELCDDGNIINGDGCSANCFIQFNCTCIGSPSACYNGSTGNLTLISINTNNNNIFIVLKTDIYFNFSSSNEMQNFIQSKFFLFPATSIYCVQQIYQKNFFDCLLIYVNGVPLRQFNIQFFFNYRNFSGSLIVSVPSPKFPLGARKN